MRILLQWKGRWTMPVQTLAVSSVYKELVLLVQRDNVNAADTLVSSAQTRGRYKRVNTGRRE